jgi:hypothetical protein
LFPAASPLNNVQKSPAKLLHNHTRPASAFPVIRRSAAAALPDLPSFQAVAVETRPLHMNYRQWHGSCSLARL